MRIISKKAVAVNSADWLLIELKNAHQRVLSGLDKLDELLARSTPDLQSYLAVRRELSSASRARSSAVQAAHDHIIEHADQAAEVELSRALKARRRRLRDAGLIKVACLIPYGPLTVTSLEQVHRALRAIFATKAS